jgi:NDP-sugar pyrophosphorylase family protein
MSESLKELTDDILSVSEFLRSAALLKDKKSKDTLLEGSIRSLSAAEVKTLEAQGNHALSWEKVKVEDGFTTDFIMGNSFSGDCMLGSFDGNEREIDCGVMASSGVYNSVIVNSVIGSNAVVRNAGAVANYIIEKTAVVYQIGALIASSKCTFGNGIEIAVGIETGGREILSYAELTIPVACSVAMKRQDKIFQKAYREFVDAYLNKCTLPFGVVREGSVIRFTQKLEDVWVGNGVIVDGAALIKNCTLLGSEEEPTEISHGAYIVNSCLQWGCEVTSMSIVVDTVLTEHTTAERHGKVIQSIIGPNTSIAEGEVTACLVGPFVGFHHQALLIASLWPEGKGNVGYGANVGSNHTSKAPDQELIIGEGVFFGLGVNVKYPSNFSEAPYSIIATAVDLLPQKVAFPFSLINTTSRSMSDISPSYNEIFPGWVLMHNIYTIRRNESKYKKRNKARRSSFVFEVFRYDIVKKIVSARDRLSEVKKKKELYKEKDIPGLGKNYMLEPSRIDGIDAYTFYIRYYALRGLQQRVSFHYENGQEKVLSDIYVKKTEELEWEYQRGLLQAEGLSKNSITDNLEKLSSMQVKIAQDTQASKERDDERGERILQDHYKAHTRARDDSFIKETWEYTGSVNGAIKELINMLNESSNE